MMCSPCFQLHITFPCEESHHQIPITSHELVTPEENRKVFLAYTHRVNSLKTALLSNLEAVSSFQTRLLSEFDQLITDLATAKQTYASQLEKTKRIISMEIELAVRQIEDVEYLPKFQPLNGFEVQVLGCWTRDPDLRSTQLFTGEVDFSDIRNQVAKLVYFQTHFDYFRSEESPPAVLAGISYNSLRLYNLHEKKESRKSLRQNFTQGTVYCFLDHSTALCVGGVPPSTSVQKLAITTGLLTPAPPLHYPRGFSGIRKHGDHIYLFGGNWPSTSTCEKLDIVDNVWSDLPSMTVPRYAFNPCYYKGELFLADAQNSNVIECFSLASETFRVLPLTLPELSGNSVAFIVDKELRIATAYGQLAVLNLSKKGDSFRLSNISNTPIISSWPPLTVGSTIYFINYSTGQLRKYAIDTGLFS